MKTLILLLISGLSLGKVGIGTETPRTMLDVKGELSISQVENGSSEDFILVWNETEQKVKKISSSNLAHRCPNFERNQSGGYHLLFKSDYSIQKPNEPLNISGLNFVSGGTEINGNKYIYRYSNTSGQALDISSFTVDFNGLICNY